MSTNKTVHNNPISIRALTLPPVETPDANESRLRQRDAQLAAYFGRPTTWITSLRGRNPVYWDRLETRWMHEAHGPLAPRHLLAAQARADRALIRERRNMAREDEFIRLKTWLNPPDDNFSCQCPDRADAAIPATPGSDKAPWLSRVGLALMRVMGRGTLIGWVTILIAVDLVLGQMYPGFWTEALTLLGVTQ